SRRFCSIRSNLAYRRWLKTEQHLQPPADAALSGKSETPLFSVIIYSGNSGRRALDHSLESVRNQKFTGYEYHLVTDQEPLPEAVAGEFLVFLEGGMLMAPDMLRRFSETLKENPEFDMVYCDEDRISFRTGTRSHPFFKPDWSPDLNWSLPYVGCAAAYRSSLVKKAGLPEKVFGEAEQYAFLFRFLEYTGHHRIGHIPEVLCHSNVKKGADVFSSERPETAEACRRAAEDHIRRSGQEARMEPVPGTDRFRIVYGTGEQPLVSVIIPSKDHPEMLGQCVRSIRELTGYKNYEILVVDNGSSPENEARIRELLTENGAGYIYRKEEFNFSRMCNRGAESARGEYLLFLNDDIKIIQPDWMDRMLGQAMQPHTGAVGAKLLYPDSGLIQHAGVSNTQDGPCHSFMMGREDFAYYYPYLKLNYNCLAVTGACLMVGRKKFEEAGRFDESYPVAYNDVKLCFSLFKAGYFQVVRNDTAAYHYESYSRGLDALDEQKQARLRMELSRLFRDFPELQGKDPFLNPNLKCFSYALELRTGRP
ncbi:MAG: glycosyltransferase, partial [Stomatobaculum sp.]|nr:glycosyltransferase [Stomatobaculum sp.]